MGTTTGDGEGDGFTSFVATGADVGFGAGTFATRGTADFADAFATGFDSGLAAAGAGVGVGAGPFLGIAFFAGGGVGFATALGAGLVAAFRIALAGAKGFVTIGAGGATGLDFATGFAGDGVAAGLLWVDGSFEGAAFDWPLGGGALAPGEEAEGDAATGERVGPGLVGFFTGAKSETPSPPGAMGFHVRCDPAGRSRNQNR